QGDDRRSKLYAAKKAIYEVMKEYDDIYFGFSAFPDSNSLRVYQKHWLYWHNTALTLATPWPFSWPLKEADNTIERPICNDVNGAVVSCAAAGATVVDYSVDIQGDTLTFGNPLTAPVAGITTVGTCAAPVTFDAKTFDALPIPMDGNQLIVW